MVSPVLKDIQKHEAAQHMREHIERIQKAQRSRVYIVGYGAEDVIALEERLKKETENGLEA